MCKLRELVLEGWLMTSAPSAACQLPSAAGDTVLAAGTTQIDINSVAYSEQSASTLGPGSQVCVELDRAQYDTPLITGAPCMVSALLGIILFN